MAGGMQENHGKPSGALCPVQAGAFLPSLVDVRVLQHGSVCSSKMPGAEGSAPGSPWHCRAELGQGVQQICFILLEKPARIPQLLGMVQPL